MKKSKGKFSEFRKIQFPRDLANKVMFPQKRIKITKFWKKEKMIELNDLPEVLIIYLSSFLI